MQNKPDEADAMLKAIASFLESNGWKVVVIGNPRIQHQPNELELNYEFVVKFTGVQKTQNGCNNGNDTKAS